MMKNVIFATLTSIFFFSVLGSGHASTVSFTYTLDPGKSYVSKDGSWNNYEFNVDFSDVSASTIGVDNTYGYCVDLYQYISDTNNGYTTSEVTGKYLKAAWLVSTYSTFTTSGNNYYGTTAGTTISALQAAIWNVLGQYDAAGGSREYYPVSTASDLSVYNLYQTMLNNVNSVNFSDASLITFLQTNFELVVSSSSQDLIVRTSAVPAPAAFWLLGSGMIGLMGYKRTRA